MKLSWEDIKHALEGIAFLPQWWVQRLHKRDERLWVFGAWDGLRYSDNSRTLYEYVNNHITGIKAVWLTHSEEIVKQLEVKGLPVALCSSKEGIKLQKEAGYFFATKGIYDADPRYMNGIRYINLWHGMPLKQIGNDAQLFIRKDTLFKRFKTFCRRCFVPWEFLSGPTLTGSSFFTPYLQSAFRLSQTEVWDVGLPRIDKFADNQEHEKLIDALNQRYNNPLKVLYMPTHRDVEHGTFNPFGKAGFEMPKLVEMLQKRNIVFLYKGHFYDSKVHSDAGERLFTITDDHYDDLYTLIKDIDVLITDYSSIYFDFLYLHKPIILFPFDEQEYVSKSRPFYFDYNLMEAKRVYNWDELIKCLDAAEYSTPNQQEIDRFCSTRYGHHCEDLVLHISGIANSRPYDNRCSKPTVSVVMCTYNGEKYLCEQLDSILAQTYPIKELIIQDNESTDGTMRILQKYAAKYPIITIYTRQRLNHSGEYDDTMRQIVNDNFLSAIGKATGDYIAIADQDDIWAESKLEMQIEHIGNNLCCFHHSPSFTTTPNRAYTDNREYNFGIERLLFFGAIPGHTMLIDKKLYTLLVNRIPQETIVQITNSCCYDTIMGVIASALGKIVFINSALSFHRVHIDSASISGVTRKDLSQRTISNAINLVTRNLNSELREHLTPIIERRLTNIGLLLAYFPEAPHLYTNEGHKFIECYTNHSWNNIHKNFRFVGLAVHNRNRIFYAKEKNQFVATLRALMFPITLYDAFWGDYQRIKNQ